MSRLLLLVLVVAACSKGTAHATARSSALPSAPEGNACDRHLVTASDAAAILGAPITDTKTLPGDAQTCVFGTAGFSTLTITLRPGLGTVTVATWLGGKMPVSATPLDGVGERAAWVGSLHEIVATKNALLCDVQASGDASQAALGALCNKIFAASSPTPS
jgi:hypothetical protein